MNYFPYLNNAFAQALPEYNDDGHFYAYYDRYTAAEDGRYRLVGLPGKAIVALGVGNKPYPWGMGSEKIDGADEDGFFRTFSAPFPPGRTWPTAMREVDIAADTSEIELDFELDPGRSLQITTVDPDGRDVGDLQVVGTQAQTTWRPVKTATFAALAFNPAEKRTLLIYNEKCNLGKVIRLRASEYLATSLTVTLEPCATIHGRVVNENRQPVSGGRIGIGVLPPETHGSELKSVATDREGRFAHAGVLPGTNYVVYFESARIESTVLAEEVSVEPGEIIDLGTIDVTSDERPER